MNPSSKLLGALALTLLLAGCGGPAATQPAAHADSEYKPTPADIERASDPCPQRLQDIAGAMLAYFGQYHHLPDTLKELGPATGTPLQVTCPDSNKPYVYAPNGMSIEGEPMTVYVWDADLVHHGIRWAIIAPHTEEGQPIALSVVPMEDKTLQAYLQANPQLEHYP